MALAPDRMPPPDGALPQGDSLLQALQGLWQELPGLVSDRVHLLALELKRAGRALGLMVGLVLGALVFVGTAWLALWGAITALLVQAGLAWGWAFAIVLVLNVAGAAFALLKAKSMAHLLTLPATVRRLTGAPAIVSNTLHAARHPHEGNGRDGAAEGAPPPTTPAAAHDLDRPPPHAVH